MGFGNADELIFELALEMVWDGIVGLCLFSVADLRLVVICHRDFEVEVSRVIEGQPALRDMNAASALRVGGGGRCRSCCRGARVYWSY